MKTIDDYRKPQFSVVETVELNGSELLKVQSPDLECISDILLTKVTNLYIESETSYDVLKAFRYYVDNYIEDDSQYHWYLGFKNDIEDRINSKAENVIWLIQNLDKVVVDIDKQLKSGEFDWFEYVQNKHIETKDEYKKAMGLAFETQIWTMTIPLKFLFVKH